MNDPVKIANVLFSVEKTVYKIACLRWKYVWYVRQIVLSMSLRVSFSLSCKSISKSIVCIIAAWWDCQRLPIKITALNPCFTSYIWGELQSSFPAEGDDRHPQLVVGVILNSSWASSSTRRGKQRKARRRKERQACLNISKSDFPVEN